jgi:agmatinase
VERDLGAVGSREMRAQSFGLETYSPYLDKDLCDIDVFDGGDLELCFGDTQLALQQIEDYTAEIVRDGKIPVMLGGEHLVTLGAFRAVRNKYPDVRIIHFDAHADLREEYLGATLSHASVIRRCHDMVCDGRIFQFGIRSGDRSEFEFAKTHTAMQKFDFGGLPEVIKSLGDKPVYLTIDLTCWTRPYFPARAHPRRAVSVLRSCAWQSGRPAL